MNLSDRITDADEACRSSEISVNLIIIIVFLQTYSYFCYILTSFFGVVVLHFRRLFIILFVCTASLTLVSDPTSRRFIRWLLFQTFIYIYIYIYIYKFIFKYRTTNLQFSDTFNNISVVSWWSVLLVEETRENHRPVASH